MSLVRRWKHSLAIVPLLGIALAAPPASADTLFALTQYDDLMFVLDEATGEILASRQLVGEDISNSNGLATDPISGDLFAIIDLDSPSRRLATIDPETAEVTIIGDTGYPFASIAFDAAGTLYGVTGASNFISSNSRNALFTIDTTDGSVTQVCRFASGTQGHALGFENGLIFHSTALGSNWSGAIVVETVDPSTFPVDPTTSCTTTALDVQNGGSDDIFIEPTSMLMLGVDGSDVNFWLSGWETVPSCCSPVIYEMTASSTVASGATLAHPSQHIKGMAFSSTNVDIVDISDLSISKLGAKIREGKERHIVFTIQVANNGSEAVDDVKVIDLLDTSKVVYVSDDSGCDLQFGYQVHCELGTLDPGESATITIDTRVDCKGKNCQSLYNEAQLSVPSDQWLLNGVSGKFASTSVNLKGKY